MRRIHSPSPSLGDCAEAVEPALQQLVERAEEAGWDHADVLTAIGRIVDNQREPRASQDRYVA